MAASEHTRPTTRWLSTIGDMVYRCASRDTGTLALDAVDYRGFWHLDDGRHADVDVVARAQRIAAPKQRPHFVAGNAWSYWREPEAHVFVLRGAHVRPSSSMRVEASNRRISIDFDPDLLSSAGQGLPPFRYPFDALATSLLLTDGIALHASALIIDGRAHAFIGPSGSGKTTIARLLQNTGVIPSDDRVIIRRTSAGYTLYGTPWPSDLRAAQNIKAPLGSLFFLAQGPESHALPIDQRTCRDELIPVASIDLFDRSATDRQLAFLQSLSQTTSAYRLTFAPKEGILDAIRAA